MSRKPIPKMRLPAPSSPALDFSPDTIRSVVARRTALRFGLSLPVAAAVAALAGLGPQGGR